MKAEDFNEIFLFLTFNALIYSFNLYVRDDIVYNKTLKMTKSHQNQSNQEDVSYVSLIGNTPMIELKKLSKLIKRKVLLKMESMNPGGTGKDRAAKAMIHAAMSSNQLYKGIPVVEGTSGSTGIALACICQAYGYQLHVVIPDDQADEKKNILEGLGAKVKIVPNCAISNENHYVNQARKLASSINGVFINQFENLANFNIHYSETGPEILNQAPNMNAFVMSAGTGGTIAGVSCYLKEKSKNRKQYQTQNQQYQFKQTHKTMNNDNNNGNNNNSNAIRVVLADPEGSSLFNRVMYGICYTPQQAERSIRRHRYDTIVEGVGLDRVTKNFDKSCIDYAIRVSDQSVIEWAHWILKNEGLFIGSSTALNIAAAVEVAINMEEGAIVVTIGCDNGQRHLSRFWNKNYVSKYNLKWPRCGGEGDNDSVIPEILRSFYK